MTIQNAASVTSGTLTTTAETAIISTPQFSVNQAGSAQGLLVTGIIALTVGTGGTAVAVRCRQGTGITGTQVGPTMTVTVAAGNNVAIPYNFLDNSAYALNGSGDTYTITAAVTGASANSTVTLATVEVESVTGAF